MLGERLSADPRHQVVALEAGSKDTDRRSRSWRRTRTPIIAFIDEDERSAHIQGGKNLGRPVGVEFIKNGKRQVVRARREVVLCAGTGDTPGVHTAASSL